MCNIWCRWRCGFIVVVFIVCPFKGCCLSYLISSFKLVCAYKFSPYFRYSWYWPPCFSLFGGCFTPSIEFFYFFLPATLQIFFKETVAYLMYCIFYLDLIFDCRLDDYSFCKVIAIMWPCGFIHGVLYCIICILRFSMAITSFPSNARFFLRPSE